MQDLIELTQNNRAGIQTDRHFGHRKTVGSNLPEGARKQHHVFNFDTHRDITAVTLFVGSYFNSLAGTRLSKVIGLLLLSSTWVDAVT
jgi:hypothetical protein